MSFRQDQYDKSDPQKNPAVKKAIRKLCEIQGYGMPDFGIEDFEGDATIDEGILEIQVAWSQWESGEYPYPTVRLFARYLNHKCVQAVLEGGDRVLHVWLRADLKAALVFDYEHIHALRTRCTNEVSRADDRGLEGVCYIPLTAGEVIQLG